ncbi:DUF3267 domain-containing protein [Arthrobacter sp. H5]|uniref:DUF3267 domain-containing protein n=1 Tax=Arthrobacter sp. H5 TaxID=1267973 RepID=UPI000685E9E1|nr:DUF3267 domain-containing protein [Arthrobacter sp. H5]
MTSAPLRDTTSLPSSYRTHRSVDFKKDRKFATTIQLVFMLVVLGAVAAAFLLELPLGTTWTPAFTIPITLGACLAYMAIHEATHGVVLQAVTKVKPTYAFRFPFLTTGNRAYLTRQNAVAVAVAPAIIWGIVLIAAQLTVPQDYLLSAYILLTLNFAGSAGDYVEVAVLLRQPQDALVKDDGNQIHVFVPKISRAAR